MSPKEASQSLENLSAEELIKKADSLYKQSKKSIDSFRKDSSPTASAKELKCGEVVKGFDQIHTQLEKQGKPDQVEVWRKQVGAYEAEHKAKQQGESTTTASEERTEEAESTPLIQQRFYIYRLIETDRSEYAMTLARDCVARGRPHPPLSKEDNLRREVCAEELAGAVLKIALDDKTGEFKDPAELEKLIATYHVTKETLLAIKKSNAFGGDSTQKVLAEQTKYQQVREAEEATREYESNKAHLAEYERRKKEDTEATVAPREAVEAKKAQYKTEASQALEEKRNRAIGLLGGTLGSHDVRDFIGVKATLPSELATATLASLTEGQGQTVVAQLEPQLQTLRDAVTLSETLIQRVSGKDALQDSIKEYLFSVGRYDKFPATQIRKVTRQLPVFKQRLDNADRQKKADLITAVNQFFSNAGEHAFAIQEDEIDTLLTEPDSLLTVCMTCDAQLRLKKTSLETMQKEWNETMPYLSTASARSTQLRTAVQEYDKELTVVKDGYSPSTIPGGGGVDVDTWIKEDKSSVRAETKPLVDAILKAIGERVPFKIPDEADSGDEDSQITGIKSEILKLLEGTNDEDIQNRDYEAILKLYGRLMDIYEAQGNKTELARAIADVDTIQHSIAFRELSNGESLKDDELPSLEKQMQRKEEIRLGEPYSARVTSEFRAIYVEDPQLKGLDINVFTAITNSTLHIGIRTIKNRNTASAEINNTHNFSIDLAQSTNDPALNLRKTISFTDLENTEHTFTLEARVPTESIKIGAEEALVDFIVYQGDQKIDAEETSISQALIIREEIRAWLVKKDFTSSGAPQALEHLCLGNDLAMLLEVRRQVGADTTIQISDEQKVAVDTAIKRIKDAKKGGVPGATGAGGSPPDGGGGGEPKDSIVDEAIGLKEGQNHFESVMYITLPLEEETLETNFFVGPHQYLQIGEHIAKVNTGNGAVTKRPIVNLYFDNFQDGRDSCCYLDFLIREESVRIDEPTEIDDTHSYTWRVERVGEVATSKDATGKETTNMTVKIICDVTTKAPEASGGAESGNDKYKKGAVENMADLLLASDIEGVVSVVKHQALMSGEGKLYSDEEGMLFRIIEEGISARETDVPRYLEALRALIDLVSKFDPTNKNIPRLCLAFVSNIPKEEGDLYPDYEGTLDDTTQIGQYLEKKAEVLENTWHQSGADIAYSGAIHVASEAGDQREVIFLSHERDSVHGKFDSLQTSLRESQTQARKKVQDGLQEGKEIDYQSVIREAQEYRNLCRVWGLHDAAEEAEVWLQEYLHLRATSEQSFNSRWIDIGEPERLTLTQGQDHELIADKVEDFIIKISHSELGDLIYIKSGENQPRITISRQEGESVQGSPATIVRDEGKYILAVTEVYKPKEAGQDAAEKVSFTLTFTKAEEAEGQAEVQVAKATPLPTAITVGRGEPILVYIEPAGIDASTLKNINELQGDEHKSADIAKALGITIPILRSWSERFSGFLPGLQSGKARRYTTEQAHTLGKVKGLLEQGWSDEQVIDRLAQDPEVPKAVAQKGSAVVSASGVGEGVASEEMSPAKRAEILADLEKMGVTGKLKDALMKVAELAWDGTNLELKFAQGADALADKLRIPFVSPVIKQMASFMEGVLETRKGSTIKERWDIARPFFIEALGNSIEGGLDLASLAGGAEAGAVVQGLRLMLEEAKSGKTPEAGKIAEQVVRAVIEKIKDMDPQDTSADATLLRTIGHALEHITSNSAELKKIGQDLSEKPAFQQIMSELATQAPEEAQPTTPVETPSSEPELSHDLTLTADEVGRRLMIPQPELESSRSTVGMLDAKYVGEGFTRKMMYSEHDVQLLRDKLRVQVQ